jgi:hypothetical protein
MLRHIDRSVLVIADHSRKSRPGQTPANAALSDIAEQRLRTQHGCTKLDAPTGSPCVYAVGGGSVYSYTFSDRCICAASAAMNNKWRPSSRPRKTDWGAYRCHRPRAALHQHRTSWHGPFRPFILRVRQAVPARRAVRPLRAGPLPLSGLASLRHGAGPRDRLERLIKVFLNFL